MSAQLIPIPTAALFLTDLEDGDYGESLTRVSVDAEGRQYDLGGYTLAEVKLAAQEDGRLSLMIKTGDCELGHHGLAMSAPEFIDNLTPSEVLALTRALTAAVARARRIGLIPTDDDARMNQEKKRAKRPA